MNTGIVQHSTEPIKSNDCEACWSASLESTMILDIRYTNKPPEQIQGVRLMTCYPRMDGKAKPEFVIHFYPLLEKETHYIDQDNVWTVSVSND